MAFPLGWSYSKTSPAFLLTVLLILASAQSSFAAEWVKYDDGGSNGRKSTTTGMQLLVKFSLPLYYQKYRILAISFYIYDLTPFRAHVFKPGVSCADLFVSEIIPAPTTGAHWIEVTMPPEIIVTGYGSDLDAFFIGIEYLTNNKPEIGFDTDLWNMYLNWNPDYLVPRSYEARPTPNWNCAHEATILPGDLMIRALVEESGGPAFREVTNTAVTQTGSVQASGTGLSFAVIAIGAGAAAAAGGLAVAISKPRSEVYVFAGHYYCRKHRTPLWSADGRLWCPVERKFLRP